MARSFKRTWLYVSREFVFSFTVAFLFFFFIFFVNNLLVYAADIFAKQVPFWDVIRLLAYSLPVVVALSFPFGSLVGALMAVGRLSSDNEILAFNVLGVPQRQLLMPLLVTGLLFSTVSFVMNDYFYPLGTIRFAEIYRRIMSSNPAVELEPHSIKKYGNTVIITGGAEGRTLKDILIIDKSPENNRRIITARSASLRDNPENKGVISLVMEGVMSEVSFPKEGDRYDYTLADSMIYNLLLKNITSSMGIIGPSQQSSVDVWLQIQKMSRAQAEKARDKQEKVSTLTYGISSAIRSARLADTSDISRLSALERNLDVLEKTLKSEKAKDVTDRTLQSYLTEFHRKFSLPAACLFFAFFGFPVGIRARRSGRTLGFAVGVLISFIYYGLLFVGQAFGVRLDLSPALSMWLPDIVVFGAGVLLFALRRVR
jgi:lipopolysaccharide export system permease protein